MAKHRIKRAILSKLYYRRMVKATTKMRALEVVGKKRKWTPSESAAYDKASDEHSQAWRQYMRLGSD